MASVQERSAGGYELDDDRDRIDPESVHRFLAQGAWWALGRPREVVQPRDERLMQRRVRLP